MLLKIVTAISFTALFVVVLWYHPPGFLAKKLKRKEENGG